MHARGGHDMNRRGACKAGPSGAGASGGGHVSRQNTAKPSTGASVIRSAPNASKSPPTCMNSFQSPSSNWPKLHSHFGPPAATHFPTRDPPDTAHGLSASSGRKPLCIFTDRRMRISVLATQGNQGRVSHVQGSSIQTGVVRVTGPSRPAGSRGVGSSSVSIARYVRRSDSGRL